MASRIVLLSVLLSSAPPWQAYAENVVAHRFVSEKPLAAVEDLLYLSAAVELSLNGFSSARSEDGADFVLLATYRQTGGRIELLYSLFRPSDPGLVLASAELSTALDYNLDVAVAEAIRLVLKAAALSPGQGAAASIQGVLPDQAAPPQENFAATAPDAGRASATDAGAPPMARYRASAAAGAIVFLGPATEYFNIGAGGYAAFGLSWPIGRWKLGLDANLAASRAFNAEGVTGGPLVLSQAGLCARLGFGDSESYWVDAILAGGAAILTVGSQAELLAKTVPYAELGISLGLPLEGGWFMGVATRFLIAFEQSGLLMGLVPTLALGLEF